MKKWLDSEDVLSKYSDGNFQGVEVGIQEIDFSKIIALSIDYEMVKDEYRMKKLKEKVNEKGWDDPEPSDLYLYQTRKGNYAVGSSGNHRSVLSNELGISKIKANVTKIYPKTTFPEEITDSIEKLYIERAQLQTELENSFDPASEDSVDKINRLDEIEIGNILYEFIRSNNLI